MTNVDGDDNSKVNYSGDNDDPKKKTKKDSPQSGKGNQSRDVDENFDQKHGDEVGDEHIVVDDDENQWNSNLVEDECAFLELMLESMGALPNSATSGGASSGGTAAGSSSRRRRHAISLRAPSIKSGTTMTTISDQPKLVGDDEEGALLQEARTVLLTGMQPKLHRFRGREYPNTFIGFQAIDVLLKSNVVSTREQGEEVCRKLAVGKPPLFRAVRMSVLEQDQGDDDADHREGQHEENDDDDKLFADNYYFYRFVSSAGGEDDDGGNNAINPISNDLNEAKESEPAPPPPAMPDRTESLMWRQKWANFEIKWRSKSELLRRGDKGNNVDEKESIDLICKIQNWMKSFRRLDPRYHILDHFQKTAHLGVEFAIESNDDNNENAVSSYLRAEAGLRGSRANSNGQFAVPNLMKYLPKRANIFTVWRPTSNDAISKMILGLAVGKGLDIKGKSAKYPHKLSGYVPFLQIGIESHKQLVKYNYITSGGRVRIYFKDDTSTSVLDSLRQDLENVKNELLDNVAQAKEVLLNSPTSSEADAYYEAQAIVDTYEMANPNINELDRLNGTVGLELPIRLFWEVFVNRQDITRIPGSQYDPDRPSEPANQTKNILTLVNFKKVEGSQPRPVLYQMDAKNPYNVQEWLMAYEERGQVKPVASDFDAFLVGTRRVNFDAQKHALPDDQVQLLKWLVASIGTLLDSPPRPSSWDVQWGQTFVKESKLGNIPSIKRMPPLGFGDQRSYKIMKHAVSKLSYGAVRHGAECFNYYVPQEMDDMYLVISGDGTFGDKKTGCGGDDGDAGEVPWRYMNERELLRFLSNRIDEGYTFPLSPKWILCDPGWKDLYDKLLASDRPEVMQSMEIWFPPESGVREQIEAISRRHKGGFEGGPLRSQEQVQKRFAKLLREGGIVYRKTLGIYARKGIKGQTIATTIDGVLETENTVKDDKSWVVYNKAAGEYYVVDDDYFRANYREVESELGSQSTILEALREEGNEDTRTSSSSSQSSSSNMFARLHRQGFREYTPRKQVCRYARKVTDEDMKWFRFGLPPKPYDDGNAAYFMAPWRAYMRVEKGDVLVMQYNEECGGGGKNCEIYRVEGSVFSTSYEPLRTNRRLSSKAFCIEGGSWSEIGRTEDDTESSRLAAGKDGRKVRSQSEVQERFVCVMKKKDSVFRKVESSYLRRALKGQKVVTVLDGVPETENVVRDDTSWIACGKTAGERYIIRGDKFDACYDASTAQPIDVGSETISPILKRLHREGFREYKSKKKVWGHEISEDDMKWFHFDDRPPDGDDGAAFFVAPWGELTRVEIGDWIVMQYPEGNPEIYRVERLVFYATYERL